MTATSVGSSVVLQQIQSLLVRLKLARSLEVLDDLVRQLENGELSALEMLEHLLSEEQNAREQRRLRSASMTARLTRMKTLDGFDFSFQPSLDRNRILSLPELPSSTAPPWFICSDRQGPASRTWPSRWASRPSGRAKACSSPPLPRSSPR